MSKMPRRKPLPPSTSSYRPSNSSSSSTRPLASRAPSSSSSRLPVISQQRPSTTFTNQQRATTQTTWINNQQQNNNNNQQLWEWDPASAQITWNPAAQATWNQVQQSTCSTQNGQGTSSWVPNPQEMTWVAVEDWTSPPLEWNPVNQSTQTGLRNQKNRNQSSNSMRNNHSKQWSQGNQHQPTWNNQGMRNRNLTTIKEEETEVPVPVCWPSNQATWTNQLNQVRNRSMATMREEEVEVPVPEAVEVPDLDVVYELVEDLIYPKLRDNAMKALCCRTNILNYLGPILWQSFAIVTALLQEIMIVYRLLSPPNLTEDQYLRVYRAITLLLCIAAHPKTRIPFLHSHLHIFLYPFLNTKSKEKQIDALRVSTLGVLGGLVKGEGEEQREVILFYLHSEIVPLCLRTIEVGGETSRVVAIYVLKKILMDELGLEYVGQSAERYKSVCGVLGNTFENLNERATHNIVRFLVRCYWYLSLHPRMAHHMREYVPLKFYDGFLLNYFYEEPELEDDIYQILQNINASIIELDANVQ